MTIWFLTTSLSSFFGATGSVGTSIGTRRPIAMLW
jgi:hypothetical protein